MGQISARHILSFSVNHYLKKTYVYRGQFFRCQNNFGNILGLDELLRAADESKQLQTALSSSLCIVHACILLFRKA